MRISIIGPSASGKTTLAKKLKKEYKLTHCDLDYVFYKPLPGKNRLLLPAKDAENNTNSIIKKERWVIEGVNPIKEVFLKADIIILLKPPFLLSIYRQWKRYFTDQKQRKEHGFLNNIELSKYLYRQYFHKNYSPRPKKEPHSFRLKKVLQTLDPYKEKVIVLKSYSDINKVKKKISKIKGS